MSTHPQPPFRSNERVAVLMTPHGKAVFGQLDRGLCDSLDQFFREAGDSYLGSTPALQDEAALDQIELSTARAEVISGSDARHFERIQLRDKCGQAE